MTASDLHDALARLGADLMVRAMAALERGALQLTKQSEQGVTYAAKIDKAEAQIDWSKPAHAVLRHIHGLSPFPGAWSEIAGEGRAREDSALRDSQRARARRAACSTITSPSPAARARSASSNCSAPARRR